MTIKLVLLKSGEKLITDIKEGFYEEKLVCYILENPCTISMNRTYKILDDENDDSNQVSISLHSWPSLSKDTAIELVPEWIITIVEPKDELKKMYETQVLGIEKNDQNNSTSEQSNSDQSD